MAVWQSVEFDQHEQVSAFSDPDSGLRAIIAIHSTALGPAVGGTRFWPYTEERLALDDALRLSRAMSYKCALAGVPYGGGKAVIIGDPVKLKTRKLLHAYGRCINRVGSIFTTGEDVGFSVADCETLREVSPFVAGTNSAGAGDPGVHTARGVFHGLRAVIEARLDRADLFPIAGHLCTGHRRARHARSNGRPAGARVDWSRSTRRAHGSNRHLSRGQIPARDRSCFHFRSPGARSRRRKQRNGYCT